MRSACAVAALCVALGIAPGSAPVMAQEESAPATQPHAAGKIAYRQDSGFGDELLRSGLVLGVLAAVFVGATYLVRRLQLQRVAGTSRRMKVLETLRLTPKSTVFLVEVDGRKVLIGQSGSGLTMLGEPTQAGREAVAVRGADD